jgi:hypothetical protein
VTAAATPPAGVHAEQLARGLEGRLHPRTAIAREHAAEDHAASLDRNLLAKLVALLFWPPPCRALFRTVGVAA